MSQEKEATRPSPSSTLSEEKLLNLETKISDFLMKYGPTRDIENEKMEIDEAFNLMEKLENETRRKMESIAQGIQKEQKLKSQNNFILK